MSDMDDLSQQYLRIRQKRELLKERFMSEDAELEKAMAEIEEQLLNTLNEANSNSMSTNSAVIMRWQFKSHTEFGAVYLKMIA